MCGCMAPVFSCVFHFKGCLCALSLHLYMTCKPVQTGLLNIGHHGSHMHVAIRV